MPPHFEYTQGIKNLLCVNTMIIRNKIVCSNDFYLGDGTSKVRNKLDDERFFGSVPKSK
jgi:hypothetical protein